MTGKVAHIICYRLANEYEDIRASNVILTEKQKKAGVNPLLVYLARLTFISSAKKTKPPYGEGQKQFFDQLQRLYYSKLPKQKWPDNPKFYALNVMYVPCPEAQWNIDATVIALQYRVDQEAEKSNKQNDAILAANLYAASIKPNVSTSESILQDNPISNNNKRRGKKNKGKKKACTTITALSTTTQQNNETKAELSNNETKAEEKETSIPENNEWLEKLEQVIRTTNGADGDEPMTLGEASSKARAPAARENKAPAPPLPGPSVFETGKPPEKVEGCHIISNDSPFIDMDVSEVASLLGSNEIVPEPEKTKHADESGESSDNKEEVPMDTNGDLKIIDSKEEAPAPQAMSSTSSKLDMPDIASKGVEKNTKSKVPVEVDDTTENEESASANVKSIKESNASIGEKTENILAQVKSEQSDSSAKQIHDLQEQVCQLQQAL